MPAHAKKHKMQVTTVRVPSGLYEEAKRIVDVGEDDAGSFNDLVVDSLRDRLKKIKEARLDAEFAEMRHDSRYQELATRIASEFESSDWDALNNPRQGVTPHEPTT